MLYIAKHDNSGYIPIKRIAQETGISYHFLGKILQTLTKWDILKSYKGPNGGVCLARLPNDISIMDVVKVIDGTDLNKHCFIGLPKCSGEQPCVVHEDWGRICRDLNKMLKERNFAQLLESYEF